MYDSKLTLRQAMLKTRNSIAKEVLDKMSEVIQTRILNMKEFANAKIIGAYHPIGSEVSTMEILSSALSTTKQLVLPRVEDDTKISFAEVKDLEADLEVGKYNIMEPKTHCAEINRMDLVLVPGIAWNEDGYRLGYGKGYYDRLLADLQTTSVGLAFEFQVLKEIPHEKNDFLVNMIVTEKRVIRSHSS